MKHTPQSFNPATVSLEGSNLIEASAGTGKTYSIALLVLRLVMEKNIPIQQILMVTFTRAAVAELELRVRAFVRLAAKVSRGQAIEDAAITELVNAARSVHGADTISRRLAEAQLLLDETSVLTIHGFCQRTLGEYAFETGQLFGAETLGEEEFLQLVHDSFHEFWRQHVTILHPELLELLLESGLDREDMLKLIREALGGKLMRHLGDIPRNFLTEDYQQELLDSFQQSGIDPAQTLSDIIHHITTMAIDWVVAEIRQVKQARGFITYDDMIRLLHEAVLTGSHRNQLSRHLQEKYKAVFIDEFQDTDREQYEIFQALFETNHILFYIGDPKQSIYGWRKADIFTYFKAKSKVNRIHVMNTNHRSGKDYIEAMNSFFLPEPEFDTFAFQQHSDAIKYIPVQSPNENKKGTLCYKGEPVTPILISEHAKKKELQKAVPALVTQLLFSGNYTIEIPGKPARAVIPGDIGILVRKNREGKQIKELLAQYGIASITIDDAKLLQTGEALDMLYVMEAVKDISRKSINKALLTSLGGYTPETLLTANEEAILLRFRTYQETWKSRGVFEMLRQFLSDHALPLLMEQAGGQTERRVSNILQLVEIIHKVSERKHYDEQEQIQWLKRSIDGELREGDEYEQRIESDEDAVKIVTIHKSKGLEYNIVLAPALDMLAKESHIKTLSYRHPETGKYIVIHKKRATDEETGWGEAQQEQENRRLLYVAVTRARYQCLITANMASKYSKSCLRVFTKSIKSNKQGIPGVALHTPDAAVRKPAARMEVRLERTYARADYFSLSQLKWRRTSYSALNPEHTVFSTVSDPQAVMDGYNRFIFRQLKKGAHTGNLLHYVFEHINFTEPGNWEEVVQRALKRLSGKTDTDYALGILRMLERIISRPLLPNGTLRLSEVSWQNRLNELEFDMPLTLFNTDMLQLLSPPETPFYLRSGEEMEGILNGKMDLFFMHAGKYYILDWKSNHLGDNPEHYRPEQLSAAMTANNYHLQYHLYTLAACRYLQLRVPGFDYSRDFGGVIYLFIRGIQEEGNNGIFVHKPEQSVIDGFRQILA
jgi:exodeoxyribonuclease V beta subunit